jgi:uncharacterized paraquat-inducible protein A
VRDNVFLCDECDQVLESEEVDADGYGLCFYCNQQLWDEDEFDKKERDKWQG